MGQAARIVASVFTGNAKSAFFASRVLTSTASRRLWQGPTSRSDIRPASSPTRSNSPVSQQHVSD